MPAALLLKLIFDGCFNIIQIIFKDFTLKIQV